MSFSSPIEPLASPPPPTPTFLLSYPEPAVLVVTINRPHAMNSIPMSGHWEAHELFKWFDREPSLRVTIITGAGDKAFSTGQDLIELNGRDGKKPFSSHPPSGFAAISRRVGKKPIIAAVNGFALGGGFEICLNCDVVIAAPEASFGLPEAVISIYAAAGGLPRLVRICGLQVASEIALTGRRVSATEAKELRLVNKISKTRRSLMPEALLLAKQIVRGSPESIFVTRQGLREAWETASVERATQITSDRWDDMLYSSENSKIGLAAFAAKKKPTWKPTKL